MKRVLLALAGQQQSCCWVCSCSLQAILWPTQWCTPSLAVTATPCTSFFLLLKVHVLYQISLLCSNSVWPKQGSAEARCMKLGLALVLALLKTARQPAVLREQPRLAELLCGVHAHYISLVVPEAMILQAASVDCTSPYNNSIRILGCNGRLAITWVNCQDAWTTADQLEHSWM